MLGLHYRCVETRETKGGILCMPRGALIRMFLPGGKPKKKCWGGGSPTFPKGISLSSPPAAAQGVGGWVGAQAPRLADGSGAAAQPTPRLRARALEKPDVLCKAHLGTISPPREKPRPSAPPPEFSSQKREGRTKGAPVLTFQSKGGWGGLPSKRPDVEETGVPHFPFRKSHFQEKPPPPPKKRAFAPPSPAAASSGSKLSTERLRTVRSSAIWGDRRSVGLSPSPEPSGGHQQ